MKVEVKYSYRSYETVVLEVDDPEDEDAIERLIGMSEDAEVQIEDTEVIK